ncbi:MAG: hypothetical protein Q8861_14210 [Bacteroidota bacterium]|nr:hypothetical protein [Bacteroidota bacterium]
MKPKSVRKHRALLVMSIIMLSSAFIHGQNTHEQGNPAFIIKGKSTSNLIYIPNQEKHYQFKIYKKKKVDSDYKLSATINSSENASTKNPYSATWTDQEEGSTDVDYKIEAYSRIGSKICDMHVIWQCSK